MERKISRRGPRLDHQPLDKTMIGMPTNFSHVGHSYTPMDRYGECLVNEDSDAATQDYPAEASRDGVQWQETEGGGPRTEEEQGGEYGTAPHPPLSPDSSRRNSRKISKDMISLPTNFRHVLHIDPTTADPEHLSLLLKTSSDLEYDLEYEEEEDSGDSGWDVQALPREPQEQPKESPEAPKATKSHRPSGRVRKKMISHPTNFQHVSHISAGERLDAPESPPPQLPPEPGHGEEGEEKGKKTMWGYKDQTINHSTTANPYTNATAPYTTTYTHHTTSYTSHTSYTHHIPSTHSPTTPPPITLPPSDGSHPPAPRSAPPHLSTTREGTIVSVGGHNDDHVRLRSGDTDFDFDVDKFRIPPPPQQNGSDVIRSTRPPQRRTYHEHVEEEMRKEEEGEEEQEEEARRRRRDWRGLSRRDTCQEEIRTSPPADAPPLPPCLPPAAARKRSIGRPTNFQHLRHIDPQAADRLLLEDYVEEKAEREGEKRRGREREREGVRERRTPSLPPSLPHIPPPQEPPPTGKLRKAMIGPPTNFQHVAHVGFGGLQEG